MLEEQSNDIINNAIENAMSNIMLEEDFTLSKDDKRKLLSELCENYKIKTLVKKMQVKEYER